MWAQLAPSLSDPAGADVPTLQCLTLAAEARAQRPPSPAAPPASHTHTSCISRGSLSSLTALPPHLFTNPPQVALAAFRISRKAAAAAAALLGDRSAASAPEARLQAGLADLRRCIERVFPAASGMGEPGGTSAASEANLHLGPFSFVCLPSPLEPETQCRSLNSPVAVSR